MSARLTEGFGCTHACAIFDPVVEPLFSCLFSNASPELRWTGLPFGGRCTRAEIERLCALAGPAAPQVIVGAGGGQALDTAKAVARQLRLPLVIVPTAASSDAPTSRLIAIYDDAHKIVDVPLMPWNPSMILVDTAVLAKAPRRLFIAGIGDAFTKRFEVADAARDPNQRNYFGGLPPHLATVLGRECHEILIRFAAPALRELDAGAGGPAFERVVEATILYSGLAFESGGLSVAHGMLRGLTAFGETQGSLHGELVSYGLLVQLHAFDYDPQQITDATRFLAGVGLPTSRKHIGLSGASAEDLLTIARLTLAAPYLERLGPTLTPDRLVDAMNAVERHAQPAVI
ncbi:iron-containing alcohol dehydrogenase [Variovorax ureilyticus]|uniref:iron-containing alcohol dehydrogenase n=1 Tax=Variovorax ureilyticus TaxID=1836198 RepID=UPI003D66D35A